MSESFRPFQSKIFGELLPATHFVKPGLIDVTDFVQEKMVQIITSYLIPTPFEYSVT